jgi:hypothetical protein
METQNITLAVPKDVLYKAKRIALERRKSLSGLLTQMLTDMVASDEAYDEARCRQLALLERGISLGTQGVIRWTREELHER